MGIFDHVYASWLNVLVERLETLDLLAHLMAAIIKDNIKRPKLFGNVGQKYFIRLIANPYVSSFLGKL